ncbi:MAG: WD40 repeat domain-containing protein [Frankia sp.]
MIRIGSLAVRVFSGLPKPERRRLSGNAGTWKPATSTTATSHRWFTGKDCVRYSGVLSVAFLLRWKHVSHRQRRDGVGTSPTAPGPVGRPLTGQYDRVISLAFSPNGRILATDSRDSTIIIWDLIDGLRLRTIRGNSPTRPFWESTLM